MFPKVTEHPGWLKPHSREWYRQLGHQKGVYKYPWRCIPDGPEAEEALTEVLETVVRGKLLDVGCGHGEYALHWAGQADEVVGFDVTETFLETADRKKTENMRFVAGDTKAGLPFPTDYFDTAYTKKGPTSWYAEGNRVVKPGGSIVGFHPGADRTPCDTEGDLSVYFPGLFSSDAGRPPLSEVLHHRFAQSGLQEVQIRTVRERGYLPSPEDVLHLFCFGQTEEVLKYVEESCYTMIKERFAEYSSQKGLLIVGLYYLVTAKAGAAEVKI